MGQGSRPRTFQHASAVGRARRRDTWLHPLGAAADQQLSMAFTLPEVDRQKAVARRAATHGSCKVQGEGAHSWAAAASLLWRPCSPSMKAQRTCHMARDSGCQVQDSSA